MKRFVFTGKVWGGILITLVVIGALIQFTRFYPYDRVELSDPGNPGNRLFAERRSGSRMSIFICVSDWPHTFLKPVILGQSNWSDKYLESNFFWSKDRSLIVWRTRQPKWAGAKYERAYDYMHHELLDSHILRLNIDECSERIEKLLVERGGMGTEVINIPDDKS